MKLASGTQDRWKVDSTLLPRLWIEELMAAEEIPYVVEDRLSNF